MEEEARKMKSILVMCALAEEAKQIERHFSGVVSTFDDIKAVTIDGVVNIMIVVCGIGEVDAAIETTKVLMKMKHENMKMPDVVMSVGCAGSHREDLHAGDVVIGTSVVPSSYKIVRPNGLHEHVGQRLGVGEAPVREIVSDESLVALAEKCAQQGIALPHWPTCAGQKRTPRIVPGRVCSCDTWTQDVAEIRRLHASLDTACEEMEAFGVFRAASQMGLKRFLAIKDISNNEQLKDETTDATFSGKDNWMLDEIGKRAGLLAHVVLCKLVQML